MPFLIGTDEAGYSPNLGPLVISCTVWRVEDDLGEEDLYDRLEHVICRAPARGDETGRVAVADSKALYSPAQGLAQLERGVLCMLGLLQAQVKDWRSIWRFLDADAQLHLDALPWHAAYEAPLPWQAKADDLPVATTNLRKGLEQAGVELVAIRSTAVFPERFNHSNEQYGNKAETLSRLTLQLVGDALDRLPPEPVLVVCDKHGGRNRYGRLLQEQFPAHLVEVYHEGPAESLYRWGPEEERVSIRFQVEGESFLPVALSSMVSKYLRELSMRAFNDFWCNLVPDLRPTAGYPGDARRFKCDIAAVQSDLGIDDDILWRTR